MSYVDGYVIPVPKKNVKAYTLMARKGAKIWKDHGALEVYECVGDDLKAHCGVPFTKLLKSKPGETVMFSWIVYKSRADRDRVNAKVMTDPRLQKAVPPGGMPFDFKRMVVGGFKPIVKA